MLLSCAVFSGTSTVPDRVAHFINSKSHLVEKGVFSNMDALEKELSSTPIDYLLVDADSIGNALPGLIARFAPQMRIVLVDQGGLFAVQGIADIDPEETQGRLRRKIAAPLSGSIQIELEGPILQRLQQQLNSGQPSLRFGIDGLAEESSQRDAIYVRHESKIIRIALADLGYVEAQKDYVVLNTNQDELRILSSMKRIVAELGEKEYYRVHRSFIVRLDRILRIEGEDLYLAGFEKPVPIGPSYRSQLLKTLRLL